MQDGIAEKKTVSRPLSDAEKERLVATFLSDVDSEIPLARNIDANVFDEPLAGGRPLLQAMQNSARSFLKGELVRRRQQHLVELLAKQHNYNAAVSKRVLKEVWTLRTDKK